MTTSGLILGEEGAQQVAWLWGMAALNVAQKEHFGEGGGEVQVSLEHRLEALFLLLMNLAQYVLDGTPTSGQAALRQSGVLSERFIVVAEGIWTFHAQNA